MGRRHFIVSGCGLALVLVAGCMWGEKQPRFTNQLPGKMPEPPKLTPASTLAATRVDSVARQLMAQNQNIGISPTFVTIGGEEAALFHRGNTELYISEPTVKQCKTDNDLAALISLEVSRMVMEQEQLRPFADREPPVQVALNRDVANAGRSADQTDLAEIAKFEKSSPRSPSRSRRGEVDPKILARSYLAKANFPPDAIQNVEPIYRAAQGRSTIEKQMFSSPRPDPVPGN